MSTVTQFVLFDDDPALGLPAVSEAKPIFGSEQIIDAAFKHFRATGFPYRNLPVHTCMQEINGLAMSDPDTWQDTTLGYHVADTYCPHRYSGHAEGMLAPSDAFNDDALLSRALRLEMQFNETISPDGLGKLAIVSGTQACSNFRPGFAMYMYRRFCQQGGVVLDTSTGYGGRLVGFMASGLNGKYIGVDPSTFTYEGNLKMAHDLGFAEQVELHRIPAEDLEPAAFKNQCDFSFTSPPYFAKERYCDEPTQSAIRYKTALEWRDGFLYPMMQLQYQSLKDSCYAVVNIADVKLRSKVWHLVEWTIDAAKEAGFIHIGTEQYRLSKRMGAGQSGVVAFEPVLIFQKNVADRAYSAQREE